MLHNILLQLLLSSFLFFSNHSIATVVVALSTDETITNNEKTIVTNHDNYNNNIQKRSLQDENVVDVSYCFRNNDWESIEINSAFLCRIDVIAIDTATTDGSYMYICNVIEDDVTDNNNILVADISSSMVSRHAKTIMESQLYIQVLKNWVSINQQTGSCAVYIPDIDWIVVPPEQIRRRERERRLLLAHDMEELNQVQQQQQQQHSENKTQELHNDKQQQKKNQLLRSRQSDNKKNVTTAHQSSLQSRIRRISKTDDNKQRRKQQQQHQRRQLFSSLSPKLGIRTLLIVMINSNELSVATEEVVREYVTNSYVEKETISFQTQLKFCSKAQLVVNLIEPILYYNIPTTSTSYDQYDFISMINEIYPQLLLEDDANIKNVDHIMFIVPNSMSNIIGTTTTTEMLPPTTYASLGGKFIAIVDENIKSVQNTMHAFGHNWGFGHAYDRKLSDMNNVDKSNVMMGKNNNERLPKMCFNGYHFANMGWYNEKSLQITTWPPPSQQQSIIANLIMFDDYCDDNDTTENKDDAVVWISIESGNNSDNDDDDDNNNKLYLSYNKKSGANFHTREHRNDLLIVQSRNNNNEIKPFAGTQLWGRLGYKRKAVDKQNYRKIENYGNTGYDLIIEVCLDHYTKNNNKAPNTLLVSIATERGQCSPPPPTVVVPVPPNQNIDNNNLDEVLCRMDPDGIPVVIDAPTMAPTMLPTEPPQMITLNIDISFDINNDAHYYESETYYWTLAKTTTGDSNNNDDDDIGEIIVDSNLQQFDDNLIITRTNDDSRLGLISVQLENLVAGEYIFTITDNSSNNDGAIDKGGGGWIEIYQTIKDTVTGEDMHLFLVHLNGRSFTNEYKTTFQTWDFSSSNNWFH